MRRSHMVTASGFRSSIAGWRSGSKRPAKGFETVARTAPLSRGAAASGPPSWWISSTTTVILRRRNAGTLGSPLRIGGILPHSARWGNRARAPCAGSEGQRLPVVLLDVVVGNDAVPRPVGALLAPVAEPAVAQDEEPPAGDIGLILVADQAHRMTAARRLVRKRQRDAAGTARGGVLVPAVEDRHGEPDDRPARERRLDRVHVVLRERAQAELSPRRVGLGVARLGPVAVARQRAVVAPGAFPALAKRFQHDRRLHLPGPAGLGKAVDLLGLVVEELFGEVDRGAVRLEEELVDRGHREGDAGAARALVAGLAEHGGMVDRGRKRRRHWRRL